VDDWPLASPETEQRGVDQGSTDAAMAESVLCVLLLGRLDQTAPSGFSEVNGRPGKREWEKQTAVHAANGPRQRCYVRRVPRGRRPVT
jgi:hypothetical protein